MDIIFATTNEIKKTEIKDILSGIDSCINIKFMEDVGVTSKIDESGCTFSENAKIKALDIWKQAGGIVVGDDSGVCIEYLHGEPGIYSARYLGEDVPYKEKCDNILERLKDVPPHLRYAYWVVSMCAVMPDGSIMYSNASTKGLIAPEHCGPISGYDSIFIDLASHKSLSELRSSGCVITVHQSRVEALLSLYWSINHYHNIKESDYLYSMIH